MTETRHKSEVHLVLLGLDGSPNQTILGVYGDRERAEQERRNQIEKHCMTLPSARMWYNKHIGVKTFEVE